MRTDTTRRLTRIFSILSLSVVFVSPQILVAQGCALCYTQAAGSTHRFIQALRSGILILVVPPMLLSVMFTVMAYRRRNSFHEEFPGLASNDEQWDRVQTTEPL